MFFLVDVYSIIEYTETRKSKKFDGNSKRYMLFRFIDSWGIPFIRSKFENGTLFSECITSLAYRIVERIFNSSDLSKEFVAMLYLEEKSKNYLPFRYAYQKIL